MHYLCGKAKTRIFEGPGYAAAKGLPKSMWNLQEAKEGTKCWSLT